MVLTFVRMIEDYAHRTINLFLLPSAVTESQFKVRSPLKEQHALDVVPIRHHSHTQEVSCFNLEHPVK